MSRKTTAPAREPPVATRLPVTFRLGDLAVAPENLRFAEPPDDGLPELAATILAAGLLQPLTVRPRDGDEPGALVLDGRRRLLALQDLQAAGAIDAHYAVAAFVETEPGRQAAAAVLTNTALPVHLADVIVAIGKMLAARLTPAAIAAALGYGLLEVRRLAALSGLHPAAIAALKLGRITLRQAKLLARLPDVAAQGEIAQAALDGFGFQEWRVSERLDAGRVTVHDRRFALVGPARYAAAGGRVEADLFAERADVLLDPDRLQAAWAARAAELAQALALAPDVEVRISPEPSGVGAADLEAFGDAYGLGLDAAGMAAWREAATAEATAAGSLETLDLAADASDPALSAFLAARIAADLAAEPPRTLTVVEIFAAARTGLEARAYGPPARTVDPAADADDAGAAPADPDDGAEGDGSGPVAIPAAAIPIAVAAPPGVAGVGHALHDLRTDVATRALIRALADDPETALVAVTARLFDGLLQDGGGRPGGALTLRAEVYTRPRTPPIPALDGDVRRRVADRRDARAASGLSSIAWVAGLAQAERLALLAELAALSLDLREERTSAIRPAARAEAAELAALCGADVARHWTPDASFLGAHPKARLLEMLTEMGETDVHAAACRKDELVARVAARAAERRWAPACLSWTAPAAAADDPDDEPPPAAPAVVVAPPLTA